MSQEERDKLEWLKRAKDGVITQREAHSILSLPPYSMKISVPWPSGTHRRPVFLYSAIVAPCLIGDPSG